MYWNTEYLRSYTVQEICSFICMFLPIRWYPLSWRYAWLRLHRIRSTEVEDRSGVAPMVQSIASTNPASGRNTERGSAHSPLPSDWSNNRLSWRLSRWEQCRAVRRWFFQRPFPLGERSRDAWRTNVLPVQSICCFSGVRSGAEGGDPLPPSERRW